MESQHYQALQRLKHCSFLPGSFDKKFVRSLQMLGPYDMLSPRQAEWVEKLTYKYRKQMAARMVTNQ